MKTMIYSLTLAALMITSFSSCSDDNDPVLTQKDWDGTTTYFASADAMKFDTYYKPSVGYVGDPMPFYDPQAKDFKIMYLQEYRPNQAGTYHPIWAVSTQDAASYTSMGELISCGGLSEQDAAIGTGSTIYNPSDKLYYTFYTGNKYQPTSSENGQVVMYATSPDFKTWTKNRTFYLKGDTDGYSKNDFRDPFVFEGEDGKYHMLISTTKSGKGVLAEYTSTDMKAWEHAGVFMTMMWDRFYECPDVFKMGDWWYLVFSEYSEGNKIHYRRSKNLYGPWEAPFDDAFDGRAYYAGRTAFDGERRVLFGWVPTRIDNDDKNAYLWGGTFVPHEVFQKEDGTLGVKPVDQMMEAFDGWKDLFNPCMKTIDTKEETLLCEDTGSIAAFKTTVKFEEGTKEFSIRFYKDEETEVSYEYRFFVEENKVVFNKCPNYPWYQCFNIGLERPIKLEADKEYEICLIIDQDISTLYINGTALNARLCDHPGNGLALTVTDGTLEAKNTKIATKINK